jgi:hypothetical protein
MKKTKIYLSLIFILSIIISFRDIIFSDFKIILFIILMFGLFWIIYYWSFTIFNKKDHDFR